MSAATHSQRDHDNWTAVDDCFETNDKAAPFDTISYDNPVLAAPLASTNPRLLLPAVCDSSRITFTRRWAAQVEQSAQANCWKSAYQIAEEKRQAARFKAWHERSAKASAPTAWAGPANKWGAIKPAKPADLASKFDDTCATELTGSLKREGEKALTLLTLEKSGPAFDAKKTVKPTRREQHASWKASAAIAGQTAPLTGYREAVAAYKAASNT